MIRSISVPYCLIGSYKTLRQNLKIFNFVLLRHASRVEGQRVSGVGGGVTRECGGRARVGWGMVGARAHEGVKWKGFFVYSLFL